MLLALALLASLAACTRAPQELRIGLAMPLSGPLSDEGRSMVQAAELAAEEIRHHGAGIPGAKVDVSIVSADDKADDTQAVPAANKLVAQQVHAVIGHITSGASIAAAPTYAQAGTPQLSMATHPRFTQLGLPTTFRIVASDAMQAQALGRHIATEFKGQGFVVVDDGSVYGRGLADGVAVELAAKQQKVVFRRSYDPNTTSFPDLLAAVEKEKAGVVVTTMELTQVRPMLQQLIAAGRSDVAVVGGDTLKAGPLPVEAAGVKRFLSTTPITDVREFAERGKNFTERYRAKYKANPFDTAHYIYDAVYLLAQAAAAQSSTHPDTLRKALVTLDPAVPVTGYLRFREDGELRYGSVSLYAASKGQWRLVARSSDW